LRFEAKAHQIKSVADLLKCQGRQIQFQSKSNAINLPLCHTQTITSTDSEVTDRPRDINTACCNCQLLSDREKRRNERDWRKKNYTHTGIRKWELNK